ncbi:helix-turn-helix transcriptional regulator (plasmid) [Acinetobacter baumannii]
MAKTLQELLASRSPESQARIQKMADELLLENQLHLIREELEISQKELAETLGIKQPSLSAIENRGNDLKISTMKKYVEAMGGKLRSEMKLVLFICNIQHVFIKTLFTAFISNT